ncbi:MAG: HAMP domain-containing protein [Chloroflexi bacterium]|nr:HAMP domain-containing protein [Chloroflexota bacterium]
MFPSLRLKLAVAFALVTFVTVVLAALGMMLLLREREVTAARERVGQFGNAVAEQVALRARENYQADAISRFLYQRAEELKLRFLLIDNLNTIIADTDDRLTGQRVDSLTFNTQEFKTSRAAGFSFTTWQGQFIFRPDRGGQVLQTTSQNYRVLILAPEGAIAGAWRGLLPRLALSGGIAMLVAVAIAYLLSRSITRPIVRVTRASEAMAAGHYDQRITVQGRDEIGRLSRTFNQMAHQVSTSHRTMRDLIGNVAHELKTPLTSIQGYSQAMVDGVVQTPEDSEHAARVINDEAERMRRLVEDLLYLSRLESGQLRIEREPVRVPALIQTAAERVIWLLRDSNRELRLQLPVDLPTIQGDEGRLEQVLANLLDNAVRFTPAGGRITLSAQWSLDSVTISVHNTGSHIAPEHLARIFERFYQVDPSRARDGHHGGLGLAIAREIVLAHGGSLTAHSEPNTGTEFRVVIPAGKTRPADDTAWRPPSAQPMQPPITRGEPA